MSIDYGVIPFQSDQMQPVTGYLLQLSSPQRNLANFKALANSVFGESASNLVNFAVKQLHLL